ncbi:tetratricopeptide repeat domain 1 [Leptinotarsa decemlineata]|uniref:tetratricopeptide repeat domain 1 n=1 Tax=Leptinotarsa decemlineata TaxID=7539 RepID=UPI000C254CD2|nr:tetratricopeptide repeat protein 1 [Leptinotarsa decemlineata]
MEENDKMNDLSEIEKLNEIRSEALQAQFSVEDENKTKLEIPSSSSPDTDQIENDVKDFDEQENDCDKQSPSSLSDSQDDDYVDEEHLKDLEVTLTDDVKEKRYSEALELKKRGNEEFKDQKYLKSVFTYTEALRLCPLKYTSDRSIFYANRAASKGAMGRKESAIEDCTKAIELNDKYVRAYLRRARLYEETDKLDESLSDYRKILEIDKGNKDALQAQYRLPPLIQQKNEKLKEEVLGKLKDLGNMILKPFGLSTANFQMNKDPNSGGYSMNFTQNRE